MEFVNFCRVTALNAVLELGLKSHSDKFSSDVQEKLGVAFASFLPGIATAATRIATTKEIQSHKVIVVS